jgi:hypothetical protein
MAKKNHRQSIAKQGNNQVIHTSYEEDDNMMPAPDLLLNYQQLDPSFIEWFKNRSDVEQKARIKFNDDRIKLAKSTNSKLFTIDMCSIFVSAVIILAGLVLSYFIIKAGHILTGSILGGGTLVTYAIRLLNFRRNKANGST